MLVTIIHVIFLKRLMTTDYDKANTVVPIITITSIMIIKILAIINMNVFYNHNPNTTSIVLQIYPLKTPKDSLAFIGNITLRSTKKSNFQGGPA